MDWEGPLARAWERKAKLREDTEAFRLLNGAFSGTPGLVVEVFHTSAVLFVYDREALQAAPGLAGDLVRRRGMSCAILKKRLHKPGAERGRGSVLAGKCPEKVVVREGSARFEILLAHPHNVGLFLDTRPLRRVLRESCRDRDVLNLFSHTCSLGLCASLGGAASVANVDISRHYLDQGKLNHALNGMAQDPVRFHCMEAERYLDWAARKGRRFHDIVLDPPSFSRWKGKTYSHERDYFRLVRKSAALLHPGGRLFTLTNHAGTGAQTLRADVEKALLETGRRLSRQTLLEPPPDFDLPASRAQVTGETAGALMLENTLERKSTAKSPA